LRLDKWLWAARFFKTRSLAAEAVERGRIRVNEERAKRAKVLHLGDEVRIRRGVYEYRVRVLELSERRGPSSEAARLYEETQASREARERLATQLKAMPVLASDEGPRPTKRARRRLEEFKRRKS